MKSAFLLCLLLCSSFVASSPFYHRQQGRFLADAEVASAVKPNLAAVAEDLSAVQLEKKEEAMEKKLPAGVQKQVAAYEAKVDRLEEKVSSIKNEKKKAEVQKLIEEWNALSDDGKIEAILKKRKANEKSQKPKPAKKERSLAEDALVEKLVKEEKKAEKELATGVQKQLDAYEAKIDRLEEQVSSIKNKKRRAEVEATIKEWNALNEEQKIALILKRREANKKGQESSGS